MISLLVHDVMDRVTDFDDLSLVHREEFATLEMTIRLAVDPIRSVEAPDMSARVMAAIAALPTRPSFADRVRVRVTAAAKWLWAPHPVIVPVRPAFLGALSTLLLVLGIAAWHGERDMVAAVAEMPSVYVQFRLDIAGASQVSLAGSFSRWAPVHEMRESAPGTWSLLLPLPPGVHDYAFLVDGREWVVDPHAHQIADGFGGSNSRIALPMLSDDTRVL